MNKLNDQRGFGLVVLSAIFVLVIVLGWLGWHVFTKLHKQNELPKSAQQSSVKVLMKVSYVGGLCASGHACASTDAVYSDGSFENHTKLHPQELTALQGVIAKTDFTTYAANPKPNCPSYADGSDEVLAFPQKYADKSFKLCELQIPTNDPAIPYINSLIQRHTKNERAGY